MKKAGRPTKLKDTSIEKIKQYLERDYKKDEVVPTIAGLAVYLKVQRDTIYEWASKSKELNEVIELLRATQEKKLLYGSLTNKLNAKISALMLVKHGYKEAKDIEVTKPDFIFDDDET